jgi:hypothetical protein
MLFGSPIYSASTSAFSRILSNVSYVYTELFGIPYISENFTPFVSGCPVTSATIFTVAEPVHASINAVEIDPIPTTAYPTGLPTGPASNIAAFCPNAFDTLIDTFIDAAANVDNFVKSRRFIPSSKPFGIQTQPR